MWYLVPCCSWVGWISVPAPRRDGKQSPAGTERGGCLTASEVLLKCSVKLMSSRSTKFPLEQQVLTFPDDAEWARFHHERMWPWYAVCVTYAASFHLPESPYAWNASSSTSSSSSAVTGGTRDLWGSREHFLISAGCNFPVWLMVLLTVAKGRAQVGRQGRALQTLEMNDSWY